MIMGKTKLIVSGASGTEPVQLGRHPCGVCGRGVGVNSIPCTRWCGVTRYAAFNAVSTLLSSRAFVCPKCTAGRQTTVESPIDLDVEAVHCFYYFVTL